MLQNQTKSNKSNPISFNEQVKTIGTGLKRSIKRDLITNSAKTAWNQFWGFHNNENFEHFPSLPKTERKEAQKQAAYETKREFIVFTAQERAVSQEIEAIRKELMAVIKAVKEVDFEIEKTVMAIPVKPGVYHVRFLERIKRILRLVREKLENSRTWLKLANTKRKQKHYWFLYKKKGTSFGLSNERTVATQIG